MTFLVSQIYLSYIFSILRYLKLKFLLFFFRYSRRHKLLKSWGKGDLWEYSGLWESLSMVQGLYVSFAVVLQTSRRC